MPHLIWRGFWIEVQLIVDGDTEVFLGDVPLLCAHDLMPANL